MRDSPHDDHPVTNISRVITLSAAAAVAFRPSRALSLMFSLDFRGYHDINYMSSIKY